MNQIVNYSFFFNLNKKGLSFLKKILIIFKINLLVITLFTSSAQATTSFVDSFSVSSQETGPTSVTFNNDGTKMFVLGYIGDDVNEYTLSTGFDVSTATFVDSFSVGAQEIVPQSVAFNNDGTKMFVMGYVGDDVNEYTLSTGFDVSTASFVDSFSVATQETSPTSVTFNNDGTKMFVLGYSGDDVNEYTLSTGFDVSTATFVDSFSVAAQEDVSTGVTFNNDGTKMFVVGLDDDNVNEYTLSTGFDVSTASFVDSFSVAAQETFPHGIAFNNDGTKMFVVGQNGDDINEYTLSVGFDLNPNVLPTLSSSVPADNASSVARDANIVLNFSESVTVQSGNITIKKTSDNSTVETFNVATSGQITGTGTSQITINPSLNFDAETEYYVLIDATAFDDDDGGSYAGISSTTALSFSVVSMVDPTTDKDVVGSIDTQSQLAKSSITQSTSTVSSRLSYLRQNKDNQNLSKQNIKLDFGNATFTSLANELLAKNDKSIIPDNWSSWSEGSISVSKIGDSTNSSSSETDGQALALGFDTKLNDNDLLGFAIQYGKSDTDVGSSGTKVDSENINLSIYRTRPLNDDNFIEGMFGVGVIESDLTRISGANTLTGSRNGTQVFGSINYGKTLDKGDFNLTPIARVDLGYTELDAYTETGTDALTYTKQTIESGLASIGLEFSDIVKFNDNKLKPFGSIEYGMDFSNSSDSKMNYVSDTSTIYTYTQGINSNHLITSVVGFEYITINNLNIISSYKRIQGNESEQTDIINVSVNFKSKQETEYAMSIDGSEDLKAGFDISKNINGFDMKFNANQSLSKNSDQAANVSLSRSF
ncbi:autotransporter domain-containing protein [Candidatus Pelagibacter ubique]|nr:autotransporter domain-containing protein [Candidatus Pelagibacter ubique]